MKYYHNNRCRKSREGLAFLESKNIQPEIINYLENRISKDELIALLKKLNISASELIRKSEAVYKENIKGKKIKCTDFELENDEITEIEKEREKIKSGKSSHKKRKKSKKKKSVKRKSKKRP